jgi:DNA invertase Pin-like site-specific DNA recombinase
MAQTKGKIVCYLRVSTDRQGRSGLGLEGQRAAVEAYVVRTGARIVREYVEIESGRHDDRPKLAEALAYTRRARGTLLVARLDRLSRSVRFIATVLDSGVEFAAADVPEANRLLLHVLAAVAENEARAISERTKSALRAAKARGVLLGSHNPLVPALTPAARRKGAVLGAQRSRRAAVEAYTDLVPFIKALRSQGLSLTAIANRLNHEGHATRTDCAWTATQVLRVLRRAA